MTEFYLERHDRMEEALQRIVQWSEAYPTDIFPEPDWPKARHALAQVGITMDSVSAHCMRHVVKGVGGIARTALAPEQDYSGHYAEAMQRTTVGDRMPGEAFGPLASEQDK